MQVTKLILPAALLALQLFTTTVPAVAADKLDFKPAGDARGHIVLISGDEEYRSEEVMPMLAKILSQRHNYRCTVLFAFGPDGADYIDSNNQQGLRGLDALQTADLMIIATRFRSPDEKQAVYIAEWLKAGKPVIGLRTATHAFRGGQKFTDDVSYDQFGRRILGEQWVSHHGRHKVEGARSVVEAGAADHPILQGVGSIFAPSDVYGVRHLTDNDKVLLRGAITSSLDPESPNLEDDPRNKPMQALAWLHPWHVEGGKPGQSFCTTAGAAVDFVDADLRRLVVNAAIFLQGHEVPDSANVDFVDPFYPTFYGFINDKNYYSSRQMKPEDFALGRSPYRADPPGSPEWPHRPQPQR